MDQQSPISRQLWAQMLRAMIRWVPSFAWTVSMFKLVPYSNLINWLGAIFKLVVHVLSCSGCKAKGIPRELLHWEWVGHARVFINVAEIISTKFAILLASCSLWCSIVKLVKLFVMIELVFQLSEKGQVVADRGRFGKYRCFSSYRRSAGRESRLEAESGAQGIKNYTGCISDFVLH